jgi:hypothetical protein
MRAIMVAGAVLGLGGAFGLGVIVGRFVLSEDRATIEAPTNAIPGPIGLDNPLADPDAAMTGDPDLYGTAPAAPLPPANIPPSSGTGQSVPPAPGTAEVMTAQAESAAAMAASAATPMCNVRVTRNTPVRSWASKDRISAVATGPTCGAASIRIMVQAEDGSVLYTLTSQVSDFGLGNDATADAVRSRLEIAMPSAAVRASAYPAWTSGQAAPTRTGFSQEAYEAIRRADSPVVCIKLPGAPEDCVATDPATGQVKVFAQN